jgi:hypothetical protein
VRFSHFPVLLLPGTEKGPAEKHWSNEATCLPTSTIHLSPNNFTFLRFVSLFENALIVAIAVAKLLVGLLAVVAAAASHSTYHDFASLLLSAPESTTSLTPCRISSFPLIPRT